MLFHLYEQKFNTNTISIWSAVTPTISRISEENEALNLLDGTLLSKEGMQLIENETAFPLLNNLVANVIFWASIARTKN